MPVYVRTGRSWFPVIEVSTPNGEVNCSATMRHNARTNRGPDQRVLHRLVTSIITVTSPLAQRGELYNGQRQRTAQIDRNAPSSSRPWVQWCAMLDAATNVKMSCHAPISSDTHTRNNNTTREMVKRLLLFSRSVSKTTFIHKPLYLSEVTIRR